MSDIRQFFQSKATKNSINKPTSGKNDNSDKNKSIKQSNKKSKKKVAVIESDSDDPEDPLPPKKPKSVSPSQSKSSTKKVTPSKKQTATPISALDFFGSSTVKQTTHTKNLNKSDENSKNQAKPTKDEPIEISDDEHDNFKSSIQQLDKQDLKKTIKDTSDKQSKIQAENKSERSFTRLINKEVTKRLNGSTEELPKSKKQKIDSSQCDTSINGIQGSTPSKREPNEILAVDTPVGKQSSKSQASSSSKKNDEHPSEKASNVKNPGYKSYLQRDGPQALGSKEIPVGEENCLEGLTFVITGVLESIERDEAKSLLERYGGKVVSTVGKKLNYLVVGRDAGVSKLAKAEQHKTNQINEDEMLNLIRTRPGKKSKYVIMAEKEALESKKPILTSRLTPEKRCSNTNIPGSSSSKSDETTSVKQASTPLDSDSESTKDKALLWVDKYKPTSLKAIIGQQGEKSNARKLCNWLNKWHKNIASGKKPLFSRFNDDGSGLRAALLSGPPGVGKTTTATLVCQELGYSYVELNASDTRSKKSLKSQVAESLNNHTLVDFCGAQTKLSGTKHCLIMDEVDGMAGNEDRGGIAELVALIKTSKIPIICMCNDRNHQKMRTLANHCFDLRFQRPRVEQIKSAMMSLAFKEGIKIPPPALNEIILAANQDVRQVLHNIAMWSSKSKILDYDQVKKDSANAKKDIKISPFDAGRKVFAGGEESSNMTLHDKSDLFFFDYSLMPLFVQENYINVQPFASKGSKVKTLELLSRAADSLCDGDLVEKHIRTSQFWALLPVQAIYSCVIPGEAMRGNLGGMINFPSWLGRNSTRGKNTRILQELRSHMKLVISSDISSLNQEYLPHLRHSLSYPLVSKKQDGVPEVMQYLESYDLVKTDYDNILELCQWPNRPNPFTQIEPKVKAALTRIYNKSSHTVPYSTGSLAKKRRGAKAGEDNTDVYDEYDEADGGGTQESDEEPSIEQDSMIREKKSSSKTVTTSHGKGKGKGKVKK